MTITKYFSVLFAILLGGWIGISTGETPMTSDLYHTTYKSVCEIVRDNYYEPSIILDEWVSECFSRAQRINVNSVNEFIREVDRYLNKLVISHLSIWDPTAMRSQWLGESRETGIRARDIKGHFIIVKLVDSGPGQLAGLQLGDEITMINHNPVNSIWDIRNKTGVFTLLRRDTENREHVPINEGLFQFEKNIDVANIKINAYPTFDLFNVDGSRSQKIGLLTIPSFVPSYFEESFWMEVATQIPSADKVVIDLRENSGGNFAAMLRALSPFFCRGTLVGKLIKPRKSGGEIEDLQDNLDPEYQSQLIDRAKQINLKTFETYPCFEGPVTILIDHDSASTTEVFAQAFSLRKKAKIFGDFSAGEVVQAIWHPLPLGAGFALSVPDSLFLTADGKSLEGVGVRPLIFLEYNLDLARDGVDSWLQEATEDE